jgi:hypothetical protein
MIAFALLALFSPVAHAESPVTQTISVTYEIPAPDSLKEFSEVTIPYAITQGSGYVSNVHYTLPATLLGHERSFDLQGDDDKGDDSYILKGTDADMKCVTTDDKGATCTVTHHNVAIDLPAVKAALAATNLPQAQKDGRLKLASFAARLGGDLVGVIRYPVKK